MPFRARPVVMTRARPGWLDEPERHDGGPGRDGAAPVTAELWPQQGQEDCRSGGVEPERGGVYPLPISAPARVPSVHKT